jgi:uncharacterized membrane protein
MTLMILGLVLFLGAHSVRIFAEDWRTARIAQMGPNGWKAAYSVVSLVGFVLICYGYGLSRQAPIDLYNPPVWTRHLAALLTVPAFILLAASKVPGTYMKQAVKHPMVAGVKAWAIAHLVANGRLADVVLFGAILAWAILDFKAARGRDKAQGLAYPAKSVGRDIAAVVIGLVAWAAFALYLHAPLIGVRPFG